MGRWLAEFQENIPETHGSVTDKTDKSPLMSVMAVQTQGHLGGKTEISGDDRWDIELANAGYHWCYDCSHWGGNACTSPNNPFRKQNPKAPRICQWFDESERVIIT